MLLLYYQYPVGTIVMPITAITNVIIVWNVCGHICTFTY